MSSHIASSLQPQITNRHPGEDYGCRCLAVKYIPPFDKNREIAKLEQQISNIQAQIDLKNGNNAAFVERIARIDIELSQILEKIYSKDVAKLEDEISKLEQQIENIKSS